MTKIRIYQVDAFSQQIFSGNPAAVCILDDWPDDNILQQIAGENNLSETAFVLDHADGKNDPEHRYPLRWFTPTTEIDLCGHATLASAYILYRRLPSSRNIIRFMTNSGLLTVSRVNDLMTMNFPAYSVKRIDIPPLLLSGLKESPEYVLKSERDLLVIYPNESVVRSISPNFDQLAKLDCLGVIISSIGDQVDFVSRFFAPGAGVNEDPVTGSAHCALAPYWSKTLNKSKLQAYQLSSRGGYVGCECIKQENQARVLLSGHAVLFMQGELHLP